MGTSRSPESEKRLKETYDTCLFNLVAVLTPILRTTKLRREVIRGCGPCPSPTISTTDFDPNHANADFGAHHHPYTVCGTVLSPRGGTGVGPQHDGAIVMPTVPVLGLGDVQID